MHSGVPQRQNLCRVYLRQSRHQKVIGSVKEEELPDAAPSCRASPAFLSSTPGRTPCRMAGHFSASALIQFGRGGICPPCGARLKRFPRLQHGLSNQLSGVVRVAAPGLSLHKPQVRKREVEIGLQRQSAFDVTTAPSVWSELHYAA